MRMFKVLATALSVAILTLGLAGGGLAHPGNVWVEVEEDTREVVCLASSGKNLVPVTLTITRRVTTHFEEGHEANERPATYDRIGGLPEGVTFSEDDPLDLPDLWGRTEANGNRLVGYNVEECG